MDNTSTFIVGANGQLGNALKQHYPRARSADVDELDITNAVSVANFDWSGVEILINASAYTDVDNAETDEGRRAAWRVNAVAVSHLVKAAQKHDLTIVHVSSDYVFDGTQNPHTENEELSPLGVYAQSKAAGDIIASLAPKHYLLRTSWLIGEGHNFVKTMLGVAQKGISPTVVADQIGRLTFTTELARAIDHLLSSQAPCGVYNITNGGDAVSWADITREIFKLADFDLTVTDTTTAKYFAGKSGTAPRPLNSTLALDKLEATGFVPRDWRENLQAYLNKELGQS